MQQDAPQTILPLLTDEAPMTTCSDVVRQLEADYREQIETEVSDTAPVGVPTLKLGVISERLGFNVTADFLLSLGFAPAATEKNSKLFHEADFKNICAAIQRHIATVAAQH